MLPLSNEEGRTLSYGCVQCRCLPVFRRDLLHPSSRSLVYNVSEQWTFLSINKPSIHWGMQNSKGRSSKILEFQAQRNSSAIKVTWNDNLMRSNSKGSFCMFRDKLLSAQILQQETYAPLKIKLLDGSNTFPCLLSFFLVLLCLLFLFFLVQLSCLFWTFVLQPYSSYFVFLFLLSFPTFLSFPQRRWYFTSWFSLIKYSCSPLDLTSSFCFHSFNSI